MEIVREKIAQARRIVEELHLDLWMIFVRETMLQSDPVLPLMVGFDVVWPSFFLFTPADAIAVVGNFDEEDFKRSGLFTEVHSYTEGVAQTIREILARRDPKTIAINYSVSDSSSDGLTHGMYLLLCDYLHGTPYAARLVSAEEVCSRVRSRKTPAEIARITIAAQMADDVWQSAIDRIAVGMTEREIAALIDDEIGGRGAIPSFPTIVNAGDKTRPGHGKPTDACIEPGDLLHVDFGVRHRDYCSDIQRLAYFKRSHEASAPADLVQAFEVVREIISESARHLKPGRKGSEIDALARQRLTSHGYPEYAHALGHQLGRGVHDGAAILGPLWERYGNTPTIPVAEGNVFTLELEIMLPGIGCVGLEEDACVTSDGAVFLGPRQLDMVVR
jgi:Xaa-Pro aminopeptidase